VRSKSKDPEWQPAIEAFRTLAADLKISTASRNGDPAPRSIAVTSSAQGEGKTFTSCNLAMIWASKGSKTLLVDADLRAGSVARYFKMPKGLPGFGDLLRGTVRLEDAIQEVPVRGGHVLHVLPAGSVTIEDGAEALHLPGRFADTFEELESAYELVFIDTPPLNIVSDSTIMAAAADAVLFVVRSGITRPDSLDLALQRLRRVNRDLVGLVLNDVKLPAYYTSYYGVDRSQ
jgi:tyrosine-protein kinase Etk/Wzc